MYQIERSQECDRNTHNLVNYPPLKHNLLIGLNNNYVSFITKRDTADV